MIIGYNASDITYGLGSITSDQLPVKLCYSKERDLNQI